MTLVYARYNVLLCLWPVACSLLVFWEALRPVILLAAQMPISPNTQSSFSTNEVLNLGSLRDCHLVEAVANEVQIGSRSGGVAFSGLGPWGGRIAKTFSQEAGRGLEGPIPGPGRPLHTVPGGLSALTQPDPQTRCQLANLLASFSGRLSL